MRLILTVLMTLMLAVPGRAWAQAESAAAEGARLQEGAAVSEGASAWEDEVSMDSVVTMRELHRLHHEERFLRGAKKRLEVGNGRRAVIGLRTNLLRLATFTPDLGLIVHCGDRVDLQLNAAWTSITVSDRYRKRYALWLLSPELRYYMGLNQRYYVGVQGEMSYRDYLIKYNWKGRRGHVYGGGLVGGYQWRVSPHTSVDFHLGVGYNAGKMTYYGEDVEIVLDENGQQIPERHDDHRFGVNHLGVNIVWDF